MSRTRVKICGLTSDADIDPVVVHGADAVGLVFAEQSPRYIFKRSDLYAEIDRFARQFPAFINVVGVFDQECDGWTLDILARIHLADVGEYAAGVEASG